MACRIYALITWTTKQRQPLITERVESLLVRLLPRIVRIHCANTLALGLVSDHVHMLLRLPPEFNVPRLAQALKGSSSRIANRDGVAIQKLEWANGYDLRSISVRSLADVRDYVRRQKQIHGLAPWIPG